MGPSGALFHVPRWDYQASYPHSPLPEWALWSNQPILLNSVICTGVGMSLSGHVEFFWRDWYAIWREILFYFIFLNQRKEKESGGEKKRFLMRLLTETQDFSVTWVNKFLSCDWADLTWSIKSLISLVWEFGWEKTGNNCVLSHPLILPANSVVFSNGFLFLSILSKCSKMLLLLLLLLSFLC